MTHICWCDTHETLTYLWIVHCQHFILATGLHRPWLDFSTPPKNRPSASVWTQKDWRSNPNCWLHKIQQMLSHCLFSFLWLLHFFFCCWASLIFTFHLTFCRPNPPLTQSAHNPPTDSDKGGGRKTVPPMGTSSDDRHNTKTGLRSAESDKTPETVVYAAASSHPTGDLFP